MKKIYIFIFGASLVGLTATYIAEEGIAKGGLVPDGETPGFVIFATGEVGGQVEPCG